MEAVSQALLTLLGRALFQADQPLPDELDWALLYQEALSHTVQLLVYDCLTEQERSAMPPEVAAKWHQSALMTLWNNEQLSAEQTLVLNTLSAAGIPCVILKGSSSALSYPKPELRCAGDIDLLVTRDTLEQAEQLLIGIGYVPPTEPHHCHLSMQRGRMITELHFEPNGIPDSPVGDDIRAFFKGAEQHPDICAALPILPPSQRAVLMLLHMLEHITGSGMGLRQVCDWAVFVQKELTPPVWDALRPVLLRFGLLRFAAVITRVCVDALSLPARSAPWCLDADASVCRALLRDILRTGNFGRKESRYGQRLFTDGRSGSRLSSFYHTGLSTCRTHFPACQKHPVLLPIAPFVVVAHYLQHRAKRERPKFQLLKMYQAAGSRQKLYHALAPFERGRAQEP